MEQAINIAPKIGLGIMLLYIIYIWAISSGVTWKYLFLKLRGEFRKEEESEKVKKTNKKRLELKKKYRDNKRKYRRTLYGLYCFLLSFGYFFGVFDFTDWTTLISCSIAVIFVDIAIFNTPMVKKMAKIEFETENEINEYIDEFEKQEQKWLDKVNLCSDLIQNATPLSEKVSDETDESELGEDELYEIQLKRFLSKYTDEFDMKPYINLVGCTYSAENIENLSFLQSLNQTLETISHQHTINFDNMVENLKEDDGEQEGSSLERVIDMLLDAYSIYLSRGSLEQLLIVPIFTQERSLLIVLKGDANTIQDVDGPHVANLTYAYKMIQG